MEQTKPDSTSSPTTTSPTYLESASSPHWGAFPSTPLYSPGAGGSPHPSPEVETETRVGGGQQPSICTSRDEAASLATPVTSGWAAQSLPHSPHSPGSLPPASANLGSVSPGWRSRLNRAPQRSGPPLRPVLPSHLLLRHIHQRLPHLTPPSRAVALGTVPLAHWL